MGGKKRDAGLAVVVGKMIQALIGDYSYVQFSEAIGVMPNTVWAYAHGVTMPSVEVLLKIAEHTNTTVDWILRGEKVRGPRNAIEKARFARLKRAEKLGVAEQLDKYTAFLIEQQVPDNEVKAPPPDYLDTLGDKLRYFRKAVLRISIEEFAAQLGIEIEDLEQYEMNAELPTTQILTRLHALYHDELDLNWLLEG